MTNDKETATIPFFVHESDMARAGMHNRRLIIALVIAITAFALAVGALVINNHMWMNYVQTIEKQAATSE